MTREATARLREELEAGEFVSGYSDESDSGSGSSEGEAGEAAGAGGHEGGGDGRRRVRARSPGGLTGIQKKQRRAGREGGAGEGG